MYALSVLRSINALCTHKMEQSNSMTVNEVTKILLGRKLGEMMVKEEEISSVLSVRERELEGLQKMANVYSATPSFGDASSTAQVRIILIHIQITISYRCYFTARIRRANRRGCHALPCFPSSH